jgi:NAD+ kinase
MGGGPADAAIGLVGGEEVDGQVPTAVALERGTAAAVLAADPDVVVAVGEPALVDLVRAGIAERSVSVLPVGAGGGVRSVPSGGLTDALDGLTRGWNTVERPVLAVEVGDSRVEALFDLMLTTEEPARISEYTVRSDGERVGRFRADAVVVTTPAGSTGYARAAEGSVLAPGTDVVGVVPVAPFVTDTDRWVLPDGSVSLTVERDETPVELLADGRSVGGVEAGHPLRVGRAGSVTVAVVGTSRPFW